jgi:hypothetical protein
MTEIILSTPGYLNTPFERMDLDTLQSIVKKIGNRKHGHIYCHALWSEPVDTLEWLVSESKKMGFSVTLCLSSSDTVKHIRAFLSEDISIEVSLLPESDCACLAELTEFKKVGFFLPLERPNPNPASLQTAMKIYPTPLKIRLGVGWIHRLSGPSPIPQEHHQLWAESLMSLITEISIQPTRIEFACGLKLCLFNRSQLGNLALKSMSWPIATCPKTFLFTPDGKLKLCFRLQLPNTIHYSNKSELPEVIKEIDKWSAPYSGLCYQSDTFDCRTLRVKSCGTGCLEHSLGGWSS